MNDARVLLRRVEGRCAVDYRRPDLAALLLGMPVERALELLPKLLPVCATAQQLAASRALEAARGDCESAALARQRGDLLRREQLLAVAWRLCVDWPRWLGVAPQLPALKSLRGLPTEELAVALRRRLPPGDAKPYSREWIGGGSNTGCDRGHDGDSDRDADGNGDAAVAMELLRRAREMPASNAQDVELLQEVELLTGAPLLERAGSALMAPSPSAAAAALAGGSVVVGPLAMGRHPRVRELAADRSTSLLGRLLQAQCLDALALLAGGEVDGSVPLRQWDVAGRCGIGCAGTARGPLFHLLEIDASQRLRRWSYLAPTDWHCAPGGLLSALTAGLADAGQLRLALAAVDPCAPVVFEGGVTDEGSEAA